MPRVLEKFGRAPGCNPCELISKGRSANWRVHNARCHERTEKTMEQDEGPRVEHAMRRQDAYCASRCFSKHQGGGGVGDNQAVNDEKRVQRPMWLGTIRRKTATI